MLTITLLTIMLLAITLPPLPGGLSHQHHLLSHLCTVNVPLKHCDLELHRMMGVRDAFSKSVATEGHLGSCITIALGLNSPQFAQKGMVQ